MFSTAVFAVGIGGATPNEKVDLAAVAIEGAAGAADPELNPVVPPNDAEDNNGCGASIVGADVEAVV